MCKDTFSVLLFVNNILQNMMTRCFPLKSTKDVIFQKYFVCNYKFVFQSIQMSWWHIQSTDINKGEKKISTKINKSRASLIAQWLRICLALQGTPVSSPVWEDPTCLGAAKPVHHNYWACALEPACLNYWAQALQIPKPTPRACAPQQEEPPL